MLLAPKKFCLQIYRVYFIVETDARTLVNQLNCSATDFLGALITRQLALLNMWEFKVRYVEGKKNVVADALSKRLKLEGQTLPKVPKDDVEEFINKQLSAISLTLNLISYQDLEFTYRTYAVDLLVLDTLYTNYF